MSTTLLPPVLWAQRKDKLYLTIDLQDVKDPKVELTETGLKFSGVAQNKSYHLDVQFFKPINPAESKFAVLPRHIVFNIVKKESGPYWDRLLHEAGKQWWLKADWSRWVEEDEDEEEAPGDFDMGGMDMSSMMGGMGGMGGMDFSNFGGDDDEDDEDDEEDEATPGQKHGDEDEAAEAPKNEN